MVTSEKNRVWIGCMEYELTDNFIEYLNVYCEIYVYICSKLWLYIFFCIYFFIEYKSIRIIINVYPSLNLGCFCNTYIVIYVFFKTMMGKRKYITPGDYATCEQIKSYMTRSKLA